MFGWGVYPQHSWKLILHKWWFHRINYEACNIIHVYFNYHIINLKLNCFSYFVNLKETEQCTLFVYQSNPSTIRNQNYTTKISEHEKWMKFFPSFWWNWTTLSTQTLFIPHLYNIFINTDSMYCHLQPLVSTIFNYSWTNSQNKKTNWNILFNK